MSQQELYNERLEIKESKGCIEKKCSKFSNGYVDEDKIFFSGPPLLNVLSKEGFQERIQTVFKILGDTLSKSFGAYGAPTIISNYPYTHVTKDGFTIMKNISFDIEKGSLIDSVIANMASDICGRLNFKVGDGTTTAIVSTNKIYEAYIENKEYFDINRILPRDIIKIYQELKDEIVEKIKENAVQIRNDSTTLIDIIRKIVYISSNGDEVITDIISNIYKEIEYPSIVCELAKDGETKYQIIEGYQTNISLCDKIYINTDDQVALHQNMEVLIFDHRVTSKTYEKILKPLSIVLKSRGRHLMCIAPFYDEVALSTIIRRDLMAEYGKYKDVNLILTACANQTAHAKLVLSDLSTLLNTTIIDKSLEDELIEKIDECEGNYELVFDVSNRNIPGIMVYANNMEGNPDLFIYKEEYGELSFPYERDEDAFRLGFVDEVSCGLEKTVFKGFHYDKDLYDKTVSDAKYMLEQTVEKYAKLGTYNAEVNQAQNRYSMINLKMGLIEVGGESQLSQKMYKDAVDDAVKAAESTYNHGYILGCNVTTSRVIEELKMKYQESDSLKYILLDILANGFFEVYRAVLDNAFTNTPLCTRNSDSDFIEITDNNIREISEEVYNSCTEFFNSDMDITEDLVGHYIETYSFESVEQVDPPKRYIYKGELELQRFIIQFSILNNKVFDLSTNKFTTDVINSAKTDIEVLTAVIDLMNILITGNQLIMTGKHNF